MRADYFCPDCGDEKNDHPSTREKAQAPLCYCTGVGRSMILISPVDGMNQKLYDEPGTKDI